MTLLYFCRALDRQMRIPDGLRYLGKISLLMRLLQSSIIEDIPRFVQYVRDYFQSPQPSAPLLDPLILTHFPSHIIDPVPSTSDHV